jgi:hypothetical protein
MKGLRKITVAIALWAACSLTAGGRAESQGSPAVSEREREIELAKKLANPIASLISLPLQYNYDRNIGPDDEGSRSVLNVQPVIPIPLGEDWSLITRTIVPLIDQQAIPAKGHSRAGFGDVLASQFFSPQTPAAGGWIWGVGPVELLPTATDETLGGEKWGLGPTAVVLKQAGPWTFGALVNHVWSVGGDGDRDDVNATFMEPFVSFITATKTTIGLNTESTYDWEAEEWSVPLNAAVSQMVKIGPQIFQISVGPRYWARSPGNGPEGWGLRAQVTLLFPQ